MGSPNPTLPEPTVTDRREVMGEGGKIAKKKMKERM